MVGGVFIESLKLDMCSGTKLLLLTRYEGHLPFLFPSRNHFGAKNIKHVTCGMF